LATGRLATTTRLETLTLNAGRGNSIINVESAPPTTTIRAGEGDDRFHISPQAQRLLNLLGDLTIDAGPDDDRMTLNDQTNDTDFFLTNSYTVTDAIAGLGLGQVHYDDTLERLTLNAGVGDSYINVESTIADTFINSGDGDDRIDISRDAQSLFNIRGPVTVNGGLGFDHLLVNDQSNASFFLFNIYTLTEDIVGLGTGQVGYNESVERMTLNTGVGPSFINVSTIADTFINSGDDDDRINITPSGQSFADIRGPVRSMPEPGVTGSSSTTKAMRLAVDNVYSITAEAVELGAAHVGYDEATEFLVLHAGVGDTASSTLSTSADTTIDAGAGDDQINVSPVANLLSNIHGLLRILAGADSDELVVNDQANPSDAENGHYLMSATGITLGTSQIFYNEAPESIKLNAGSGANVIDIASNTADTTIVTGPGTDEVHVGAGPIRWTTFSEQ
jgi:acrosin